MEHTNAAEWDLHRRRDQPAPPGDDGHVWQTVARPDKGKEKVKQQDPNHNNSKAAPQKISSPARHPDKRAKRSMSKWRDPGGKAPQTQQQHPRTPKLIEADDGNEAQGQWRALEPAKLFVRVPTELAFADDGESLQRLARQHSCYVASEQRPSKSPDSQTFGIWGTEEHAEKTRSAIDKWIEEMMGPQRSARAGKFAKLASMTPVLRDREEKRWKRDVQRQRFRQHPPVNMAFGAIGTFHWPIYEYAPREILGPNYEALDPIRMSCSCYVVWQKNTFQVMGKSMEKVKAALQRLRQTVFQIAAKQLLTSRMYLLHWPRDLRCESVRLAEYEQPGQLSGPTATEIKQHPSVRGEGVREGDLEHTALKKTLSSERRIHWTILRTLNKLPRYRGGIKLRLHFGRFLTTQYMLPENGVYDLEEYESMIKESQFQGLITDEYVIDYFHSPSAASKACIQLLTRFRLGDREMEQAALSSLQLAADLLVPLDHAIDRLSAVTPIYTVVFTFAGGLGGLRLTCSWRPADDGLSFDIISQRWTRMDRDTSTAASLVKICLTDLTTSFGWAFNMEATQPPVDEKRIEPALVNLALGLKIDVPAAQKQATDRPFVKFSAYVPKVALRSIEQRLVYAYGMKDLDYNVELTRFQTFIYPERKMGSIIPPEASQIRSFEPRWGVSVHRGDWDTMFAENERLGVGEKASWEADTERWFPKGWSDPEETDKFRYFSSMVAKLNKLDKLLRDGAKVEDLLGGKSIG